MSVKAFLERFILRRESAPVAPPLEDHPAQAPVPPKGKATPWRCGVARLDEQYDALFKVIRQFQGALRSGAKPGTMEEALTALVSHAEGHLALEEAFLEQIGFPGLAEHRHGHQAFRHQIRAFQRRIADGDPNAGLELSQQLFAWLRVHIAKEDSIWSEFAKTRRRR
jgi:hemerythrin